MAIKHSSTYQALTNLLCSSNSALLKHLPGRFYDRQDSIRSGYASDHERGYASDRDSRGGYMSDRERAGYVGDRTPLNDSRDRGYMSDRERGYVSDRERSGGGGGYMSNRERGYYSDRERGYVSDRERGYMSDRDQRGYVSDRDSRGYASDRERGYYSDREHTALMAQASMESADSRLCYLTSSEVRPFNIHRVSYLHPLSDVRLIYR